MAIELYFSAIELSEYRISYWRIQETIRLSDIRSRPQSIGISDIGKNYRLPTSAVKSERQQIKLRGNSTKIYAKLSINAEKRKIVFLMGLYREIFSLSHEQFILW